MPTLSISESTGTKVVKKLEVVEVDLNNTGKL